MLLHFCLCFLSLSSPNQVTVVVSRKPHDFSVVISSDFFFQGCYTVGPPVHPFSLYLLLLKNFLVLFRTPFSRSPFGLLFSVAIIVAAGCFSRKRLKNNTNHNNDNTHSCSSRSVPFWSSWWVNMECSLSCYCRWGRGNAEPLCCYIWETRQWNKALDHHRQDSHFSLY